MDRRVSIIVPAYNEAPTLEAVVAEIIAAAEARLDDWEILIVDDGSTDQTGLLADHLAQQHRHVRALHHAHNRGIAAAYATGLGAAMLDYVTFVGADGEIHPRSIRRLFATIGTADLIIPYHATPQARQWHRRILTRISTALVNHLFGFHLRYFQGPVIYPTALARRLPKTARGFYFLTEMLVHALTEGYGYTEVPLFHRARQAGESQGVSVGNIIRALWTIWTVYQALHR